MIDLKSIEKFVDENEKYINKIIEQIDGDDIEFPAKQTAFLDNQDQINDCVDGLSKFCTQCHDVLDNSSEYDNETIEGISKNLTRANTLISRLKRAAKNLRDQLSYIDKTSEKEEIKALTVDEVAQAMQNDSTTKKIANDMQEIISNESADRKTKIVEDDGLPKYVAANKNTHTLSYIDASSKSMLNEAINQIINKSGNDEVKFYKISYEEVKLKETKMYTLE